MTLPISGKTKVYGVLGHPIQHTCSPLLQNSAFQAHQLEAVYLPFAVHPDQLKGAVAGIRSLGIAGVNVTLPHKTKVLPHLDEITPTAQRIGAVNTIRNDAGILVGTNTDGLGFLRSLSALSFSPYQKTILLLGAGGAARSIVVSLAEAEAKCVLIANRTLSKALELAEEFSPIFPKTEFHAAPLPHFFDAPLDLLVNTTHVGMEGHATPVDLEAFQTLEYVVDIIYSPPQTPLLQQAKQLNLPCINGMGMLLHQGCAAFEFWTQQPAPVALMEQKLRAFLQEG